MQVHVNGQVSPLVTQGAVAMQRIVPAVQPAAKDFTVILLRLVIYLHPCCCDGEHVLCGLGLPPRVSEAAGCVQTVRMMFVCVSHQLGLLLDPMETIVAAHFASAVLVVVEKGFPGSWSAAGFRFPTCKFEVCGAGWWWTFGRARGTTWLFSGLGACFAGFGARQGAVATCEEHMGKVSSSLQEKVEAELGLLISKQHAPGTVPPRAGPPSLQRTSSATAPKSLGGLVAMRLYKGWIFGDGLPRIQACPRGSCGCAPKSVLLRRCPGSGTGLSTHVAGFIGVLVAGSWD